MFQKSRSCECESVVCSHLKQALYSNVAPSACSMSLVSSDVWKACRVAISASKSSSGMSSSSWTNAERTTMKSHQALTCGPEVRVDRTEPNVVTMCGNVTRLGIMRKYNASRAED